MNYPSDVPRNLVSESFTWDNSYVFTDPLVGVEIHGETSVVLLYDHLGRLLHRLRSHSPLHKMTSLLDNLDAASRPPNTDS